MKTIKIEQRSKHLKTQYLIINDNQSIGIQRFIVFNENGVLFTANYLGTEDNQNESLESITFNESITRKNKVNFNSKDPFYMKSTYEYKLYSNYIDIYLPYNMFDFETHEKISVYTLYKVFTCKKHHVQFKKELLNFMEKTYKLEKIKYEIVNDIKEFKYRNDNELLKLSKKLTKTINQLIKQKEKDQITLNNYKLNS
jgi:hypothetical protein